MASLAKLTSLSTQTLSLLLERQRLQNLNSPSLHTQQIARNLDAVQTDACRSPGTDTLDATCPP